MNRYCWCQYASPLCTAGRTAGWPLYCSAAAAVMMGRDTSNCTHFCRIVDSGHGHVVSLIFMLSPEYFCNLCHRIPRQLDTLCKHYQFSTIMCVRWGTTFAGRVLGGERRLDCVNLLTECGCWVTVMVTVHTFACVSKYVLYCQWYIFEQHNYLCNAHGASRNPPHHLFTDGGPRRGPVTMIALLGKLFG